jgi:protein required for attachment to host cells
VNAAAQQAALAFVDVHQHARTLLRLAELYCWGREPFQRNISEVLMARGIPHNAFVLVADGTKALFLRNEGDALAANLKTELVLTDENPPTHEQGTDRPGHGGKVPGTQRRSGMEPTDWHDIEEQKFARRVAAAMEEMVRTRHVKALLIAAPPRTLAELRRSFHDDVKQCIVVELHKDLTKHSVAEIEKHMVA